MASPATLLPKSWRTISPVSISTFIIVFKVADGGDGEDTSGFVPAASLSRCCRKFFLLFVFRRDITDMAVSNRSDASPLEHFVGDTGMQLSEMLLAAALVLTGTNVVRADQSAADLAAADEGLKPVKVTGLDHVYARPGINLNAYDKVMLDPVEVSFAKSEKPDRAGGPITAAEKQEIRIELAKIFKEELEKELTHPKGYALVNHADGEVLRIRAEIRDLNINAPAVPSSGPTRPYAVSVSEMRLVAELRDAATGALIARVVDSKKDPSAPWLHFTARVDAEGPALAAINDWARILRRELDSAHGLKE